MIARIWHGIVPVSKADEYLDLMRRIALPEYLATRGNRGAWCLHRTEADVTHFEMLTFWDDTDAIKRFAGDDFSLAKYYDFDSDYLIEKEVGVRHYEVSSRLNQPATFRRNQVAVDVTNTHRVIFKPDHKDDPGFRIDNYKSITAIVIMEIFKNYHQKWFTHVTKRYILAASWRASICATFR